VFTGACTTGWSAGALRSTLTVGLGPVGVTLTTSGLPSAGVVNRVGVHFAVGDGQLHRHAGDRLCRLPACVTLTVHLSAVPMIWAAVGATIGDSPRGPGSPWRRPPRAATALNASGHWA